MSDLSRPILFFVAILSREFTLLPCPTNCPWVSEDDPSVKSKGSSCFNRLMGWGKMGLTPLEGLKTCKAELPSATILAVRQ